MASSIGTTVYTSKKTSLTDTVAGDILFAQPRYRPNDLNMLCATYNFSRYELKLLYQGFKQNCPNGVCLQSSFKNIFKQFFPLGDATSYANYVFQACQRYTQRKSMNFENYLTVLSCMSRGSLLEKTNWLFSLYDIEGKGKISRKSMLAMSEAVNLMLGVEYSVRSPDHALTTERTLDKVFKEMDTNGDGLITYKEFCQWCQKDKRIVESILVFDTVF